MRTILVCIVTYLFMKDSLCDTSKPIVWKLKTPVYLRGKASMLCMINENNNPGHMAWAREEKLIGINNDSLNAAKYDVFIKYNVTSMMYYLVIKNIEMEDLNLEYKCESGFLSAKGLLPLNEDSFVALPKKEDISSYFTFRKGFLKVDIDVSFVYPKPRCIATFKNKDITRYTDTNYTKESILYSMKFQLVYQSNECGVINISCVIGKDEFGILQETREFNECEDLSSVQPTENGRLSFSAIVGIVAGAILLTMAVIFLSFLFWKRRKKRNRGRGQDDIPLIQTDVFLKYPSDCECMEGEDAIFQCILFPDSPRVRWQKNGEDITINANLVICSEDKVHTLILKNTRLEDAGEYCIQVDRCVRQFHLHIKNVFLKYPSDCECMEGEDAIFQCILFPDSPRVRWQKNGEDITINANHVISSEDKVHTLILKNTRLEDAGEYCIQVDRCVRQFHLHIKIKPADIGDNESRWLVIGICLHSVLAPVLRKYIALILRDFYSHENFNDKIMKIGTQKYPRHLVPYPPSNILFNYETVNNNIVKYGFQKTNYGDQTAQYDKKTKAAVNLSKIFLKTHMADYIGVDSLCDTSDLLELIINIDKFPLLVQSDAEDIRRVVRNPWVHCNMTEWNEEKYSSSFQLIGELVWHLGLSASEQNQIIKELCTWKINGHSFLRGTTVGTKFGNSIRQHTQQLAARSHLTASDTDTELLRIKNELDNIKRVLWKKIDRLETDMYSNCFETDKTWLAQRETVTDRQTKIDIHNAEVEFWKEQDVVFVETPVVKMISNILKSETCVLISGETGIGKTMLLHHLALTLHCKMGFTIIPCLGLPDILLYHKKDERQVFVLDDMCGRYANSMSDIAYLEKNKNTIKNILIHGNSKIAVTCVTSIFMDERFNESTKLFDANSFNLSTEYSKEDRLMISTKYLTNFDVQLLKDQNVEFTPLMCYLYSRNKNFKLTDFMKCPLETYTNELDNLKSFDPHTYCLLFLCVIFNGNLKESLFDPGSKINSTNKHVLETAFEICRINRSTSEIKIKSALGSIIGTYVRKTRNAYRIIHDQMLDFMCYYFGNKDSTVRVILQYADIHIINEHIQLESINEQRGTHTIVISRKHEQAYFERIKSELKLGNISQCLSNSLMKHVNYRASVIKILRSIYEKKKEIHEVGKGKDVEKTNDDTTYKWQEGPLITCCSNGYYDIVEFLLLKVANIEKLHPFNTHMNAACRGGNVKIVQLLIDIGSDVNHADDTGVTPLIAACSRGNEKIVQLLINKGSDVNQADDTGVTPLMAACSKGNEKIVELLIDIGSDVNHADDTGVTPLIAACSRGNEKIVQLLIDNGSDVNHADDTRVTPLIAACSTGNEKIVQLLIDKESDVNLADGMGVTPLIAACSKGNEKIVQLLIDKRSDVNLADGIGVTPLMATCSRGNEKIVQLLIDKGSDVNIADGMGVTPLTTACWEGNEKIVQLLIDKGSDVNLTDGMEMTPLTAACWGGSEKIVQLLLDQGSVINNFEIPLTAACMRGYEKIVTLLLNEDSNVNNGNCFRETPLTAACMRGNMKIVQLLIDKGSYVNLADGMGVTPLTAACRGENKKIAKLHKDNCSVINHYYNIDEKPLTAACMRENMKIVQLLIDKGSDVNLTDGMGVTPLIAACCGENEKIVQLLIDNGSDINHSDSIGETPLTAACRVGNEKLVMLLLNNGSNLDHAELFGETDFLINKTCKLKQVRYCGETPLTAACSGGHDTIVELLLRKGCVVNQTDGLGDTPLTAACQVSNAKIVQILLDKGCYVNQAGFIGLTPLTSACAVGNEIITQLLIYRGGDVNQAGMLMRYLKDVCFGKHENINQIFKAGRSYSERLSTRETPLTIACLAGYEKIVQILIDSDSDVNQCNARGESPLTVANRGANKKIPQLLVKNGAIIHKG